MLNCTFGRANRCSGHVIAIIRREQFGLVRLRSGVVWRLPLSAAAGLGKKISVGVPVEIRYSRVKHSRDGKAKPKVHSLAAASPEVLRQLDQQAAIKIKATMKPKHCGRKTPGKARLPAIWIGVGQTRKAGARREGRGHN